MIFACGGGMTVRVTPHLLLLGTLAAAHLARPTPSFQELSVLMCFFFGGGIEENLEASLLTERHITRIPIALLAWRSQYLAQRQGHSTGP